MSKLEIGTLMAIGPFVSVFANPFWGYACDRSQNIRRILLIMIGEPCFFASDLLCTYLYVDLFFDDSVLFLSESTIHPDEQYDSWIY